MTQSFQFTETSYNITIDRGRGEVTFKVLNSSGRPLRRRAKPVALGNTKADWLTLRGESERDFSTNSSQSFTVEFAAPEGTPPGEYPFQLEVVSVVNPDEVFTEGPSVTAVLKAVPLPPTPPIWKWLIPLIIVVLLVGGLVTWLALKGGGEADNNNVANVATPVTSPSAAPPTPTPTPATPTPTPTPFKLDGLTVEAQPTQFVGTCPHNFLFVGTIFYTGQGEVTFQVKTAYGKFLPASTRMLPLGGVFKYTWNDDLGVRNSAPFPWAPQPLQAYSEELTISTASQSVSKAASVTITCK